MVATTVGLPMNSYQRSTESSRYGRLRVSTRISSRLHAGMVGRDKIEVFTLMPQVVRQVFGVADTPA